MKPLWPPRPLSSLPRSTPGNSISDWAKMIGITPPWFTRRGRNCLPPPYTRRPRVYLACWTAIRRWAWVIRIDPMMMKTNSPSSVRIFPALIEFGPPRPLRSVCW